MDVWRRLIACPVYFEAVIPIEMMLEPTAGANCMIEGLEISHLRTLDALFRASNITAAAEHINLSQQAVSQQLQRLRKLTGDRLFVPSGHGMVPTPYARQIESQVSQVLVLLNEIQQSDSLTLNRIERTLTISSTDHAQKIIVGPLLQELRDLAPGVKVVVVDIESAELTRRMHQGDVDIAFTSSDHVPTGLVSEPLFRECYRCVSSIPSIAGKGKLSLKELIQHPFIVVSPGVPNLKGSASDWFDRKGLQRRVVVSVPSFFMAQEYLRNSDMVGFLPSRLLPSEGLTEIPLEAYPPGYEVVAAYHASSRDDQFRAWLLDRVRMHISDAV